LGRKGKEAVVTKWFTECKWGRHFRTL